MTESEEFYKTKVIELAESIQKARLQKRGKLIQFEEPKYVIYVRRSTKAPKGKGKEDKTDKQERSIKDQIDACKDFADKNNLKWVDILEEQESAHKTEKRDVFYHILDTIRSGKSYNSIIAWHPDRLARNMKDSGMIMDMIDAGIIVDLKFPSFTFVNDPSGKMALGIQFVLAKNYSDGLSVTTIRGIDGTIGDAKYSGKSKHGYIGEAKGYYRPNKETFHKVQKLWQEAVNGTHPKEIERIATRIGYPIQYKALMNMLHEPFYCGIYIHGNNLVEIKSIDPQFVPMISYKDFITIDRNIADRRSFDYTDTVENILFKKMVKCTYCNRFMSPYKSRNKYGDYYYYIGCTNNSCKTKKDRKLKRTVRGKLIMDYVIEVLENKINITRDIYEDAIKDYGKTRASQVEIIQESLSTLNGKIFKLESTINGLSMSLSSANEKIQKNIIESINQKSSEIVEKKEEIEQLEEELIKIESKISEDVIPYEKFSNFFKKAGQTIKSSQNTYLLDQLLRNVFLNFFVEDGKVIGHRLKEPFATYESLGVKSGVENFHGSELFKNIKFKSFYAIKEVLKTLDKLITDNLAGLNQHVMDYKL